MITKQEGAIAKAVKTLWWVARDFALGRFPPKFEREQLYESESRYVADKLNQAESSPRAPWCLREGRRSMNIDKWKSIGKVLLWLDDLKLPLGSRILEVGAGCGWLSEIITIAGYNTVCTTLALHDIKEATRRSRGLVARELATGMLVVRSPMETVAESLVNAGIPLGFDVCVVHGALHHAYAWKEAVSAVNECLRSGGHWLICDEPSWYHTIICYRGSMIEGRHEVGFWKRSLTSHLNRSGFRVRRTSRHLTLSLPIWIDAEKQCP